MNSKHQILNPEQIQNSNVLNSKVVIPTEPEGRMERSHINSQGYEIPRQARDDACGVSFGF